MPELLINEFCIKHVCREESIILEYPGYGDQIVPIKTAERYTGVTVNQWKP